MIYIILGYLWPEMWKNVLPVSGKVLTAGGAMVIRGGRKRFLSIPTTEIAGSN